MTSVDPQIRARQVLGAFDGWFPYSINPEAVTTAEFALAGLVRCRRLLEGMIGVHDSPDLGGMFARALYETYLSSLYLLLAGNDAHDRLTANDDHERRRIARRILEMESADDPKAMTIRAQSAAVLAAPPVSGKRIDTAALARELSRMLHAKDDPNAQWPIDMYASLFGPESYTTAHGGLGAIKQYMLESGRVSTVISAEPWHHPGNDRRLELMTAAVLTLAMKIGSELGLPIEGLRHVYSDWLPIHT